MQTHEARAAVLALERLQANLDGYRKRFGPLHRSGLADIMLYDAVVMDMAENAVTGVSANDVMQSILQDDLSVALDDTAMESLWDAAHALLVAEDVL